MIRASVVVLAEDRRQQRFAYRYLKRRKFRDIRLVALPAGKGCGEQYVRERYAKEVEAYRSRFARTALVVAIDADTGSVEQRARQLQDALTEAHLNRRSAHERIAHLIPKRSIETWILCLGGNNVDEDTDYSRKPDIDEQVSVAAETFYGWTRANATVPERCVPSLKSAIPEARRLE